MRSGRMADHAERAQAGLRFGHSFPARFAVDNAPDPEMRPEPNRVVSKPIGSQSIALALVLTELCECSMDFPQVQPHRSAKPRDHMNVPACAETATAQHWLSQRHRSFQSTACFAQGQIS